jgi:hypothetical protein
MLIPNNFLLKRGYFAANLAWLFMHICQTSVFLASPRTKRIATPTVKIIV